MTERIDFLSLPPSMRKRLARPTKAAKKDPPPVQLIYNWVSKELGSQKEPPSVPLGGFDSSPETPQDAPGGAE